jgi:hypothetical protein
MFMFHHFLTGRGAPGVSEAAGSPADALRAAQCWMLDPAREWPDAIRGQDFAMESRADGFSSLRAWAAFTHHGR